MYVYTHRDTHTHAHTQPFSLSQIALLHGEWAESPSVPLPAKPELQGVGGGQLRVLTTPEPGLFQGKALCS